MAIASNGSTQGSAGKTQVTGGGEAAAKAKKPVDKRLPVPPAHEIRRADAKLQAYFQQKYPLDTNLAEYRFYHALYLHYVAQNRGKHHPVMRYASMMLIVRLAPLQQDVASTFNTISALAREYRVNSYRLMAKAGEEMIARRGMRIYTADTLLNDLMQYAPKAMEAVHFRSAELMARSGITLARLTGQRQDLNQLIPILVKARLALPLCGAYRHAMKRLTIHPHAPAANATAGLFLACFTSKTKKADAHLLRSGDPRLIAIAHEQKTLQKDSDMTGRGTITLAENWLSLSEDHPYHRFRRPLRALAKQTATAALSSIDSAVLTALKTDHYHQAQHLLSDAQKLVSKLDLPDYSQRISAWKLDQKELATLRSKYRAAILAMNEGKSSATAFQTIGEYLCFVSGRWKQGLAYLKRSNVGDVRAAASADVKAPTSPARQKALGDMWWSISDKYTGLERYNIRSRAVYWYNLARTKLHGSQLADIVYRNLTLKRETF
jgi:hypothetical protein